MRHFKNCYEKALCSCSPRTTTVCHKRAEKLHIPLRRLPFEYQNEFSRAKINPALLIVSINQWRMQACVNSFCSDNVIKFLIKTLLLSTFFFYFVVNFNWLVGLKVVKTRLWHFKHWFVKEASLWNFATIYDDNSLSPDALNEMLKFDLWLRHQPRDRTILPALKSFIN